MRKYLLLAAILTFCFCTACQTNSSKTDIPANSEASVDSKPLIEPDASATTEALHDTNETNTQVSENTGNSSENVDISTPEQLIVSPLPSTLDLCALDNCTIAINLEKGNAYVDDTGAMQMKVTVYTYDLYDMVDIAMLKEGDIIRLNQQDVLIETLTRSDSGYLCINGGLDQGGYDLCTNENTVYYEIGYSDMKSYYAVGEIIIPVSADFTYIDHSDLDNGDITYSAEDFLTDTTGLDYYFSPHNTTLRIEDGYAIEMHRIYTP